MNHLVVSPSDQAFELFIAENMSTGEILPVRCEQVVDIAVAILKDQKVLTMGVGAINGGLYLSTDELCYTLNYAFIPKVVQAAKMQGITVMQRTENERYPIVGEGGPSRILLSTGQTDQ